MSTEKSPSDPNGKAEIALQIKSRFKTVAYVGDGVNDLPAKEVVDRFIGYGGAYYRPNIEMVCDYYIKHKSFLPLLPLLLTRQECDNLKPGEKVLYDEGQRV